MGGGVRGVKDLKGKALFSIGSTSLHMIHLSPFNSIPIPILLNIKF